MAAVLLHSIGWLGGERFMCLKETGKLLKYGTKAKNSLNDCMQHCTAYSKLNEPLLPLIMLNVLIITVNMLLNHQETMTGSKCVH